MFPCGGGADKVVIKLTNECISKILRASFPSASAHHYHKIISK